MTLRLPFLAVLALSLVAVACGTPADLGGGDEELLTLDEPLGKGKTDTVSETVIVKGALQNGAATAGKLPLGETWGWKFEVPANAFVRASVFKTEDAPFYPAAYLYGPVVGKSGGRRLAEDRARDAAFPETVITKPGTYLFVVQDPGGTWPAKFGLSLDWVESPCAGVACEADAYVCGTAASSRAHLCRCEGGDAKPVEICERGSRCTGAAGSAHCE